LLHLLHEVGYMRSQSVLSAISELGVASVVAGFVCQICICKTNNKWNFVSRCHN